MKTSPVPMEALVPANSLRPGQLSCPHCGSTHFMEAVFHQYRDMTTSSPGGDLSPVSGPIRMLVCACGEPVPLSRLRSYNPRDRANREQSFAAAQRHRAAAEPEAIAKQLAETLASREEQDRLAKRLAHLEAILKRMPEPKAKKRRRNRRPA